ncbi:LysM peptidoglycan-binding domain-containing protein [Echinicola strongylocentroti]|uniref:LysM peptidoglycan-binding domain-containing protein n=1 Tax=Echinicola strongylocentroti TaxID=1795355 RepID=A0A2Z4IPD1_9BACT|nr:LysM peptidoglycan-binding domain-containing protein [Echinicola strongylocentroti]AWW32982.1 LysM peptidoglycan-binding domain-containing protein [Echinicola strongylocentroti]
MSEGKLEKLKIVAYKDSKFSEEVDNGEFTTLLNPEKYKFQYRVEQNEDQAAGTSAAPIRFNKILPQTLELDFLFDRTGVIAGYEATENGVIDDVTHFKKVVYDYNGEKHKPNYLMITWGSLLFKGYLKEMDIEYKLFRPDGTPIRALATAKVGEFVEEELRTAQENNQSPDLTHYRVVKDGDTLPLMTYRIYGDSKYYLEVAKANGLTNFRHLKTGTELRFPPLQKQK